jgi:hypothetical protein
MTLAPLSAANVIAVAMSENEPDPVQSRTLSGRIRAPGAMPATPAPLFIWAAIVPETWGPCVRGLFAPASHRRRGSSQPDRMRPNYPGNVLARGVTRRVGPLAEEIRVIQRKTRIEHRRDNGVGSERHVPGRGHTHHRQVCLIGRIKGIGGDQVRVCDVVCSAYSTDGRVSKWSMMSSSRPACPSTRREPPRPSARRYLSRSRASRSSTWVADRLESNLTMTRPGVRSAPRSIGRRSGPGRED